MELELLDKTITANNGLKFADIFNYEDDILLICFASKTLTENIRFMLTLYSKRETNRKCLRTYTPTFPALI